MPSEQELIAQRLDKRERLLAQGDAYPARVARTHTTAEAVATYEAFEVERGGPEAAAEAIAALAESSDPFHRLGVT
ncbi:MAG: hypothetical protein WCI61_11625, partial [Chloroflexota bacterium]